MDFKSLPNIVEELRVTPSDEKRHENNSRSCPFQTCTLMQVGVWSLGLAVIKWTDFESKIFWLRKIGSDMRGEIGNHITNTTASSRMNSMYTFVSCIL